FFIADSRPGGVTQARLIQPALQVANLVVRVRKFPPQRRVASSFGREAIKILESLFYNELACRGRAWQIFDGVVKFEDERICELSNVIETSLRSLALDVGGNESAGQRETNKDNRGDRELVSPDKLSAAIPEGVSARDHRLAIEMSLDVIGELC